MRFLPSLRKNEERDGPPLSFDDWANLVSSFSFQGVQYTQAASPQEQIQASFAQFAGSAFSGNSVVFAAISFRMSLFASTRFQWRQVRTGGPGQLFGTPDLAPLEQPWPGGTTGDLLAKALLYSDLGGNCFFVRENGGIVPLRPDWVTLIIGSDKVDARVWDPDAEVIAIVYQPGGPGSENPSYTYLAGQFAHFAPQPDPLAQFRGMSWLTPVIREVMSDKGMTDHKMRFLDNSATPQMIIKLDTPDAEKYRNYIKMFKAEHEGAANAYRTLFLAQGADATVVGKDLRQMDFAAVQAAGEARIASAARVPPVLIGLKSGLDAATYSNFSSARRLMVDGTMDYLWRNVCKSLEAIVPPPPNAELWFDLRDVAFVQEDQQDKANIMQTMMATVVSGVNAGFFPQSVIDAVAANDITRLDHSGLLSVQLQPPGSDFPGTDGGDGTGALVGGQKQLPPGGDASSRALERIADTNQQLTLALGAAFSMRSEPLPPITIHVEPAKVDIPAQPAPQVHFAPGAISTNIEPAKVEFEKGAFQIEAAKTPDVHVQVDAPPPAEINVTTPEVSVQIEPPPPAEVNVTVEGAKAPEIRVEQPDVHLSVEAPKAPDVSVNVEQPAAPEINIRTPEVRVEPPDVNVQVDAPPPAEVNVTTPEVNVTIEPTPQPVSVNVEAPPVPEVNVTTPEVKVNVEAAPTPNVEVTVEPAPPAEVNVTVEPGKAPKVEFAEGAIQLNAEPPEVKVDVHVPDPKPRKRTVEFSDGRTASIEEEG